MFTRWKTALEYNDDAHTLDRCPVCDGRARYMRFIKQTWFSTTTYYYVECELCGLRTKLHDDVVQARFKWNGDR